MNITLIFVRFWQTHKDKNKGDDKLEDAKHEDDEYMYDDKDNKGENNISLTTCC